MCRVKDSVSTESSQLKAKNDLNRGYHTKISTLGSRKSKSVLSPAREKQADLKFRAH